MPDLKKVSLEPFGDAEQADVLEGKTFTSKAGVRKPGTMPDVTPEVTEQTSIIEGIMEDMEQNPGEGGYFVGRSEFENHTTNKNNPHGVTAAQLNCYTKNELGSFEKSAILVEDWNQALYNGFFMANGAANAPTPNDWYIGLTLMHNDKYCVQRVFSFASTHKWYQRTQNGGNWSAWTEG